MLSSLVVGGLSPKNFTKRKKFCPGGGGGGIYSQKFKFCQRRRTQGHISCLHSETDVKLRFLTLSSFEI